MKIDNRVNRLLIALKGPAETGTSTQGDPAPAPAPPQITPRVEDDAVVIASSIRSPAEVAQEEDERSSRLEQLKLRVQAGVYQPSPQAIADSIIRELGSG